MMKCLLDPMFTLVLGALFYRREGCCLGTYELKPKTSSPCSHHSKTYGVPPANRRHIQRLGNYCILINSGARFPFSWPELNHSWALFWLLLSNFVQNSPRCSSNMTFSPQKSCITQSRWCSQRGAMANSIIPHWHLTFFRWLFMEPQLLASLSRFQKPKES